jgi:hypothetical protein
MIAQNTNILNKMHEAMNMLTRAIEPTGVGIQAVRVNVNAVSTSLSVDTSYVSDGDLVNERITMRIAKRPEYPYWREGR